MILFILLPESATKFKKCEILHYRKQEESIYRLLLR
jgi:hypothetical protein